MTRDRAFDPEQLRTQLLSAPMLAQAQALSTQPLNLFFWHHVLNRVAAMHFIGLAADASLPPLLALTRQVLGGALSTDADCDRLARSQDPFEIVRGLRTLALADWIATDTKQTATFERVYAMCQRHARASTRQKPSLEHDIYPVIAAACAAERPHEAQSLLATQFPGRTFDPKKSHTLAAFALVMASGPGPHRDAAERFLRANLASPLEHSRYAEGALFFYLASLAGLPGTARDLLASAPQYVRYLQPAPPRAARPAQHAAPPPPPPAPSTPLPPRLIASSEGFPQAVARALGDTTPHATEIWLQTPEGWAVHLRYSTTAGDGALFEQRKPSILELAACPTVYKAETFPRLVRASLDAASLSALARAPRPVPLEVAFAPAVDNWVDGRRVPVPPRLVRKDWKDALAVGALTRLRAISLDAREDNRTRLKRGAQPYPLAPDWFWTSPLAAQLEALEVIADPHDLGVSLALFDAHPRLRELVLWFWPQGLYTAGFWITRQPDGLHALVQSAWTPTTREWRKLLDTLLPATSAPLLRDLVVQVVRPDGGDEGAVRREFERHAPVSEVRLGVPLREF